MLESEHFGHHSNLHLEKVEAIGPNRNSIFEHRVSLVGEAVPPTQFIHFFKVPLAQCHLALSFCRMRAFLLTIFGNFWIKDLCIYTSQLFIIRICIRRLYRYNEQLREYSTKHTKGPLKGVIQTPALLTVSICCKSSWTFEQGWLRLFGQFLDCLGWICFHFHS